MARGERACVVRPAASAARPMDPRLLPPAGLSTPEPAAVRLCQVRGGSRMSTEAARRGWGSSSTEGLSSFPLRALTPRVL